MIVTASGSRCPSWHCGLTVAACIWGATFVQVVALSSFGDYANAGPFLLPIQANEYMLTGGLCSQNGKG